MSRFFSLCRVSIPLLWGMREQVLYLYVSKSISDLPTAGCVCKSTIFPTSAKLQLKMVEGLFIWEQRTLQQYCRKLRKLVIVLKFCEFVLDSLQFQYLP